MERHRLQLSGLWVVAVLLGLLAHQMPAASQPVQTPAGPGQDRQEEPVQRLEDLIARLRETRSGYYRQKARDEAEIERARQNRETLQSQLADLRRQEVELDGQLEEYRSEIETLEAELQPRAILREAVARERVAFVRSQEAQLGSGIPYKQQERLARLRAGSSEGADPLAHLWSYAREELRLARSSETYTDRTVIEGGSTPYARYFRVGQLLLGYVTEDGRHTAVWVPTLDGGRWQSPVEPVQVSQVRDTVEILDRRQAPRFVSLPIDIGLSNPSARDR